MQFSIRSILALTVVIALALIAVRQYHWIAEIEAELPDLRGSVNFLTAMADKSQAHASVYQNYLDANPIPSRLLVSVENHFVNTQDKYGSLGETSPAVSSSSANRSLLVKTIPESNAAYHQRYQSRVFVPDQETVQLRLAVFPCTMYRSKDAPPISKETANTILVDNPFSPAAPVYIDLPAGEHTILVQWRGDTQSITVSVDDVQQYQSRYTIQSNLSYKYQALGSGRGKGLYTAKDDEAVIGLRTICPGGGPNNDPMLHAWKCDLVRGSALKGAVKGLVNSEAQP